MESRCLARQVAARPLLVALVCYTALLLLILFPLVPRIGTHILADDIFIQPGQSDAYNFLWTYWWVQKALSLGMNVYDCQWILPPTGANLLFHTHVILPTVLTYPLGRLCGPVAGYNLMIFLLLVGAATVNFVIVHRVFGQGFLPSLLAGFLFGFCPYFVFKVHAHPNLVGAVFWQGALGTPLYVYGRERFGLRWGIVFAAALWAAFWTSFVEFVMCSTLLAAELVLLEIWWFRRRGPTTSVWSRLAFLLPALAGGVSLLILWRTSDASWPGVPVVSMPAAVALFTPPRLGLAGGWLAGAPPEVWGNYVPISLLVLALLGMGRVLGGWRWVIAPLALASCALTVNLLGIPGLVLRSVPMVQGFRVFSRFLPFLLFFLSPLAAAGAARLLALRKPAFGITLLSALLLLFFVECYPVRLRPSPVKTLDVSRFTAAIDRTKFILIVPDGPYLNHDDTYQVALDMPAVTMSYHARPSGNDQQRRASQYPALYARPLTFDQELYDELRKLNVGYVLFENASAYVTALTRGRVIYRGPGGVVMEL